MARRTIEQEKELLGFEHGTSRLYKRWRDAIKERMVAGAYHSCSTAGTKKWAELTEYALTLKPVSERAGIYGTATEAGIAMQLALKNLLQDTGKKLKDTQDLYGDVVLYDPTPPTSASSHRVRREIDWKSPIGHPRACRIHWHRPSLLRPEDKARHPFKNLTWRGSGHPVQWGELVRPTMDAIKEMLQNLEPCVLNAPRYLVGSTGSGSHQLHATPSAPIPTSEMVFLTNDALVRTWFMSSHEKPLLPLDLLVVERRSDGDATRETPDRNVHRYLPKRFWDNGDTVSDNEDGESPGDAEDLSVDAGESEREVPLNNRRGEGRPSIGSGNPTRTSGGRNDLGERSGGKQRRQGNGGTEKGKEVRRRSGPSGFDGICESDSGEEDLAIEAESSPPPVTPLTALIPASPSPLATTPPTAAVPAPPSQSDLTPCTAPVPVPLDAAATTPPTAPVPAPPSPSANTPPPTAPVPAPPSPSATTSVTASFPVPPSQSALTPCTAPVPVPLPAPATTSPTAPVSAPPFSVAPLLAVEPASSLGHSSIRVQAEGRITRSKKRAREPSPKRPKKKEKGPYGRENDNAGEGSSRGGDRSNAILID